VTASGKIVQRVTLITATPVYDPVTKALVTMSITTRDYSTAIHDRSVQRRMTVTAP
jgi:hypothetical protein